MRQVVYSSSACVPFTEKQLTDLLDKARANNANLNVTGMLLYHEGSFLQVLEGDPAVLEALFETIGRDKRHHRVVPLLKREVDVRHFEQWQMGFASRKNLPEVVPGYSDYLKHRDDKAAAANAASKLLAAFRDGRFHNFVTG